jgi:vancomycin permeability regulator SanA
VRIGLGLTSAGVLAAGVPYAWVQAQAYGHVYDASDLAGDAGPRADVVIVLGAQVAPGGIRPMPFLQYRLDTAADLLASGHAKFILVSGDEHGTSGDETRVMRDYLVGIGVDPRRVVSDPYGLDTYDTCVRARRVYGVTSALVVSQRYHVPRAVTLCRRAGIDAEGVAAHCDGCGIRLLTNGAREYFADTKAAWDTWRHRPPAIMSPPTSEVADALALSLSR